MRHDDREFARHVVELMQSIGPVSARRMFGGHGFFLEGLMFALMADGTLYLKADMQTAGDFERLGLAMFTYEKKGREYSLSYYQAPEEILESPDEMNVWANKAYGAALRAPARKVKRRA